MIINPEDLARPVGYSHGVRRGSTLYVAGQVGWDREGRVAAGFVPQFRKALENILSVVRAAGGQPEDVARMTVFVTDKQAYLSSLKELGAAYREVMGRHFPAMTLVQVAGLVEPGALVEIEATAELG